MTMDEIKPKTITFKDGRDKDRVITLLKGTRMRNRMPESIRGNASKSTLWAVEYLSKLLDGGVDNLQAELFEPESQEMSVITSENAWMKQRIKELEDLEDGYVKDINRLSRVITEWMKAVNALYLSVKRTPGLAAEIHVPAFIDYVKQIGEWNGGK